MFKSKGFPHSQIRVGRGSSIPEPTSGSKTGIEVETTINAKDLYGQRQYRSSEESSTEGLSHTKNYMNELAKSPSSKPAPSFKIDEAKAMAIIRKLPANARNGFMQRLKRCESASEARDLFQEAYEAIKGSTVHAKHRNSSFE